MLHLLLLSLSSAQANINPDPNTPVTVACIGQAAYAEGALARPALDALATCGVAQRAGARTLVFTDLPDARALQQALGLIHDTTPPEVSLLVVYAGMGAALLGEPGMLGTGKGPAQDLILPLDEALRLLSRGRSAPTALVVDACSCAGEGDRCELPRPVAGEILLRAPLGQMVQDDDALATLIQEQLRSQGRFLLEGLSSEMKRKGMNPVLLTPETRASPGLPHSR